MSRRNPGEVLPPPAPPVTFPFPNRFRNIPEPMPLSKDPEKAARQLANLQKGRAAAAEKAKSLSVVPYAAPAAVKPVSSSSPAPHAAGDDEETGGGGGMWWMLAGAVLLVVVLVFLSRRGGRDDEW